MLTDIDGLLDNHRLAHLVAQIVAIKEMGFEVILVSSGAVGAGRSMYTPKTSKKVENRQVLASIGQPLLIEQYRRLFESYQLLVGQVLATKEDFRDRHHYLNMRNCLRSLLSEKIIPIINENDVVAIDELMFTDNDELAGLVASMVGAQKLIMLTNVDGVFDRSPDDPDAQVIDVIDPKHMKRLPDFNARASSAGRGGMTTKFKVASRLATMGIDVHIANGKTDHILEQILSTNPVGTRFQSSEQISPLKKWIAFQEGEHRPTIYVNEGAAIALRSNGATSLLPIGVQRVEGQFKKGDIAHIKDLSDRLIGIGQTQYGSDLAMQYQGEKGHKALIHYNYLYIISQE